MRRRRLATLCATLAAAATLVCVAPLAAHDLERTRVTLDFTRNGRFELIVWHDPDWLVQRLERFAGDASPSPRASTPEERDRALERLAPLFVDRIVLFVDGHEVRPESVEFVPSPRDVAGDSRPLVRYRLRGRIPLGTRTLRWYYGLVVDPYPLEIRRADGRRLTELVLGDAWSTSLDLAGQFEPTPRWLAARRGVVAGATAIVPHGLESLLFVIGLTLASRHGWRRRLLAVFAGSAVVALGGALLRATPLPSAAPAVVAAASLVFVALEGVSARPFSGWRMGLLAAVGGAHGLRIATHVRDAGLAGEEAWMLTALAVGSGVVAVLLAAAGLAVACVACYRDREWYRDRIAVPMAIAAGGAGVAWATARLAAVLARA